MLTHVIMASVKVNLLKVVLLLGAWLSSTDLLMHCKSVGTHGKNSGAACKCKHLMQTVQQHEGMVQNRCLMNCSFNNCSVRVAKDTCSASSHLHSLNMICRDAKPKNVGFDANAVVKLFDFGLAREIGPRQRVVVNGKNGIMSNTKNDNQRHDVTGKVGTMRQMAGTEKLRMTATLQCACFCEVSAKQQWHSLTKMKFCFHLHCQSPEACLHGPCNLIANVHSFSLSLWQMCSLERPFVDIDDADKFVNLVMCDHVRPNLSIKR